MSDVNKFERMKTRKNPDIARVYTVSPGPSEQYNALIPSDFPEKDWEDWYFWCPMPPGTYYAKELLEMMLVMIQNNPSHIVNRISDQDSEFYSGIYWIVELSPEDVKYLSERQPIITARVRSEIETVLKEDRFPEDEKRRIKGVSEEGDTLTSGDKTPVKAPADSAPAQPATPRPHRPSRAVAIVDPSTVPNDAPATSQSTRAYDPRQNIAPASNALSSMNYQVTSQAGIQGPPEHNHVTDPRNLPAGGDQRPYLHYNMASAPRTLVPNMPPGGSSGPFVIGYPGAEVNTSRNVSTTRQAHPHHRRNRGTAPGAPSCPRGKGLGHRILYSAPPANAPVGPRATTTVNYPRGYDNNPMVATSNPMYANAPMGPRISTPVPPQTGHYNQHYCNIPMAPGNRGSGCAPMGQSNNAPMYPNIAPNNNVNAPSGVGNTGFANSPMALGNAPPRYVPIGSLTGNAPMIVHGTPSATTNMGMHPGNTMFAYPQMGHGNPSVPNPPMVPSNQAATMQMGMQPVNAGVANPPVRRGSLPLANAPMGPSNPGCPHTPMSRGNNPNVTPMGMSPSNPVFVDHSVSPHTPIPNTANAQIPPPPAPTHMGMYPDYRLVAEPDISPKSQTITANVPLLSHRASYPNLAIGPHSIPAASAAQVPQVQVPQGPLMSPDPNATFIYHYPTPHGLEHGNTIPPSPTALQGNNKSTVVGTAETVHVHMPPQTQRRNAVQLTEEELEALRQESKKLAWSEARLSLDGAVQRKAKAREGDKGKPQSKEKQKE